MIYIQKEVTEITKQAIFVAFSVQFILNKNVSIKKYNFTKKLFNISELIS